MYTLYNMHLKHTFQLLKEGFSFCRGHICIFWNIKRIQIVFMPIFLDLILCNLYKLFFFD